MLPAIAVASLKNGKASDFSCCWFLYGRVRCWRDLLQPQGMCRMGPGVLMWLELSSALAVGC